MQYIDVAFIPARSLEMAKEISKILYKLTIPVITEENVTQFYCGWIEHPVTKEVRIAWSKQSQPIHVNADAYAFDEILDEFIVKGYIKEIDKIAVQESIKSAIGIEFVMYNALPNFWKGMAKTYEQLKEEGWFLTEDR